MVAQGSEGQVGEERMEVSREVLREKRQVADHNNVVIVFDLVDEMLFEGIPLQEA